MTGLTWQYLTVFACMAVAAAAVCRRVWRFWTSAGSSSCSAGCSGCSAVADGACVVAQTGNDDGSGEASVAIIEPENIELLYLHHPE